MYKESFNTAKIQNDLYRRLGPSYSSNLISRTNKNKTHETFGSSNLKYRQYWTKKKRGEVISPSEDSPKEFWAAKNRGEVKPGITFEVWWSEQ